MYDFNLLPLDFLYLFQETPLACHLHLQYQILQNPTEQYKERASMIFSLTPL